MPKKTDVALVEIFGISKLIFTIDCIDIRLFVILSFIYYHYFSSKHTWQTSVV